MTGCSGTATTGVTTTSASSTGVYCSIGCAGCGAASKLKSKRDPPLVIEGRLATPKDYWQDDLARHHGLASLPVDYLHDDSWKRGYIPQLSDPDFANNVNNFITEQTASSYPGAKPCPINYQNPFSTALTVAFDAPPDEGNYLPSLVGLEGLHFCRDHRRKRMLDQPLLGNTVVPRLHTELSIWRDQLSD